MTHENSSLLSDNKSIVRFSTGIVGLDRILLGGFIPLGCYIILGTPGTGKTILGNQVCFNHVINGGKALYVTLLAETHSRMLSNLQLLDFYNPAVVSEAIYYISGYKVLERDGIKGLNEMLRKEIRRHKATLLILDGLTTAETVSASPLAFKEFIDQLHGFTELNNCTTLLLSHYSAESNKTYRPEYTMVDGIIELRDVAVGDRNVRELVVSKFRSGPYLRGQHQFEITKAGLVVYPRTEEVLSLATPLPNRQGERQAFGIEGLDKMLNGGLPPATTTMVAGVTGSGKTLLGIHFLAAGAAQAEAGLYFGFHESPDQLISTAMGLGLSEFANQVKDGLIEIIWQTSLEGLVDVLAERLLTAVRQRKVKRVVIDSFQGFEQAYFPERLSRFFTALDHELQLLGINTLILVELRDVVSPIIQIPITPISTIFNNIILLRYTEYNSQLVRLLSIMKERGSPFDSTIRQFIIGANGLEVTEPLKKVESTFTGTAHSMPDTSIKAVGSIEQAPLVKPDNAPGLD